MKKKGFTLIELLVVIAIIAMLMAILMPALGKVKRMAERIVCGSNLRGLGNAVAVYASDYDDEYPVHHFDADNTWRHKRSSWQLPDRTPERNDAAVAVSSSLYLLVKEADVDTKVFVCKSADEQAFEGETPQVRAEGVDLIEVWDFGDTPYDNLSYSYQLPYAPSGGRARPVSGSSDPSMAVMADKNPWTDSTLTVDGDVTSEDYMSKTFSWANSASNVEDLESLPKWVEALSNSGNHQREGQNVLFNDMHVTFHKRADVGVNQDNIWMKYRTNETTEWAKRVGEQSAQPVLNNFDKFLPHDREDNVLVSDENPANNDVIASQ
ncbi:putative major pilin subunit [Anaerohalosphaera lusitana]|uniref:Putative major pilin subunit n=1 Tax=Anaerohalosphaera lusitana TaxID=1936003 RepID=A0A1U9NKX5_9BACT|nr:type II secretion system protein [Anaerohalosphaera lusitana]AQT68374.1 putative major pilin subunit [Anaerohalosphaera lusitana]